MKALYKYPHAAFPYADLVAENARRGKLDPEYELVDTKIFDDDAYFDIEVEYAKRAPTDTLVRITVTNRGSQAAVLHVIPAALVSQYVVVVAEPAARRDRTEDRRPERFRSDASGSRRVRVLLRRRR